MSDEKAFFSIVLYVDLPELFLTSIESLEKQKQFDNTCQLIIVASEETAVLTEQVDKLKKRMKFAPVLVTEPGISAPEAYNIGISKAEGKWVNFALASASFSDNVFAAVTKAIKKHRSIPAFSLKPVCVNDGTAVQYALSPKTRSDITVNLDEQFVNIQLVLQAYFFKYDLVVDRTFKTDIHEDAFYCFLFDVLENTVDQRSDLKAPVYRFLAGAEYRYATPLEDDILFNIIQHEKYWYIDSIRDFLLPYLESFSRDGRPVPAFIQYACIWLIESKYRCNYNDGNKHVLDKDETAEFNDLCAEALVYIDNYFISQRGIATGNKPKLVTRAAFLKAKAAKMNCDLHLARVGAEVVVRFHRKDDTVWQGRKDDDLVSLERINQIILQVQLIRYEKKHIIVNGMLEGNILLTGEPVRLYAMTWTRGKDLSEHHIIEGVQEDIYCLKKHFGQVFMKDHPVSFKIPVRDGGVQKIHFYIEVGAVKTELMMVFPKYASRLDEMEGSFWQFKYNHFLIPESFTEGKPRELWIIEDKDKKSKLRREKDYQKTFLNKWGNTDEAKKAIRLRRIYLLTRKFFAKKRIWVSYDKLYKAGDNGEYMYQYGRMHCGEKGRPEIYYIVNKDAPEYERLIKEKNAKILLENSLKCFLYCMNAQAILATHPYVSRYVNDSELVMRCMRNLFKSKVVCIQHGLSINKIAHFQNQWFDDTSLYTCASPFEKENLSGIYYGYKEQQLQLTGLARYDGLKSDDKKIILITPTWRKEIAGKYVFGEQRKYNGHFKESLYYKIYRELMSDPELIGTAKKAGYRIVYVIHPALSSQLPDFGGLDYVEVIAATGAMSYERILTESSLMVTDYSGIQFDFVYQNKPVVYYHPESLPPHYEEGGLVYETMGFGPICRTHTEIVSKICEYIGNECAMEEAYRSRAEAFFTHHDFNNCERIYSAVEEMLSKK